MGDCAQGSLARMAVKAGTAPYTWSSGATRLAFFQDLIVSRHQVENPDVITGDLFEHAERSRFGPNLHYGPITLPVSPGDLAVLLPFIMGSSFSGTTITPSATALSPFGLLTDKNPDLDQPEQPQEWQEGYVDRAVFFGRQHGPGGPPNWLTLQLWVAFKGKADAAWPDLSFALNAEYTPFVFEDLTLTLDSVERNVDELYLEINNHLEINHYNSLNPTKICPRRKTFRLVAKVPYDDDHDDLEETAIAGIAGSAAFVNGTVGTTFTYPNLQAPRGLPVIRGKTETHMTLQYAGRMISSSGPLSIDNDSTP